MPAFPRCCRSLHTVRLAAVVVRSYRQYVASRRHALPRSGSLLSPRLQPVRAASQTSVLLCRASSPDLWPVRTPPAAERCRYAEASARPPRRDALAATCLPTPAMYRPLSPSTACWWMVRRRRHEPTATCRQSSTTAPGCSTASQTPTLTVRQRRRRRRERRPLGVQLAGVRTRRPPSGRPFLVDVETCVVLVLSRCPATLETEPLCAPF